MKRERMTFSVCSAAVLLASVIGFSCAMCLVETFELLCHPEYLIATCCITAGFAVAAMAVRHSWIVGLAALVVYFAGGIWQLEAVIGGMQAFLYHMTYEYSLCFENVILMGAPGADTSAFFIALAVPLTWLIVWLVCREGRAVLAMLACAPVLVLCLLVVNLAPIFWLLLLTAALLLLLLSERVRSHSAHEGSRLIWWLALPVAIVFFVLLMLSPVESYTRSDWSANLQRIAEGNFDLSLWQKKLTSAVSSQWSGDLKRVDLRLAGPQTKTGIHVLQYQSDVPIKYLRGNSLGHYEDNVWERVNLPVSITVEQTQLIRPSSAYDTVLIETSVGEPQFYTPYHPAAVPENGYAVDDAYLENPDRVRGYAVRFCESSVPQISAEYETFVYDTYLQVPDTLQPFLDQYLQDHGLSDAEAEMIADVVRASGTYDLNTPAVPNGEDFVLYFLSQSKQGYCIHFAASTVLLLRSAGIPARYVTGYAVDGAAGEWVEVTEDDAHAWVEYYVDAMGWQVLDPTPAANQAQEPGSETDTEADPVVEQTPDPNETKGSHNVIEPTVDKSMVSSSVVLWWLIIPVLLILICFRRFAILYCRRVQAERGHPNRRALNAFHRLTRLYKARGAAVPERWICLAEKAKFSQHKITEEELLCIFDEIEAQVAELKKAPFLHGLWHRFGSVLY